MKIQWPALFHRAVRKTELLRRNGPVMKSAESVLRLEGSLWWELERERELWMVRVVS